MRSVGCGRLCQLLTLLKHGPRGEYGATRHHLASALKPHAIIQHPHSPCWLPSVSLPQSAHLGCASRGSRLPALLSPLCLLLPPSSLLPFLSPPLLLSPSSLHPFQLLPTGLPLTLLLPHPQPSLPRSSLPLPVLRYNHGARLGIRIPPLQEVHVCVSRRSPLLCSD